MPELQRPEFTQASARDFPEDLGTVDRQLQGRFSAYSETPALDSKVLLAALLQRPKSWVIAHPEYRLSPADRARLLAAVEQLDRGKPLPYVLGKWEFFGLSLIVSPEVLIPRPETELLVQSAVDWLRAHPDRRLAADVGTGSGCIAVALAKSCPDLRLLATDISLAALDIARRNALQHGVSGQVSFLQADLLQPVRARFDLICANLPYIPTGNLESLQVFGREPARALDGGPNGLSLIGRLLSQTEGKLRPGGLVLLEIEAGQGRPALDEAKRRLPQAALEIKQDLAGLDRLLCIQTAG